jgi:nitrite reductase (NADH) small subunit
VACPLHNWCIDLASGQAAAPDVGSVERFEVAVVEGFVEIATWAPASAGTT